METELNHAIQSIKSYVFRQGRLTTKQKIALSQAETHKFSYYQQLQPSRLGRPVVLEIGFGNGQSLMAEALANPGIDYIGVEVYPPGVGNLLSLCEANKVDNVFVFQGDVESFLACDHLPKFSKIQIFFPDPWHKRRHHKRRLISDKFVDQLTQYMVVGGLLHIATDWDHYAQHVRAVLQKAMTFKQTSLASRLNRALTKYENRAIRLGHSIYEFVYVRI